MQAIEVSLFFLHCTHCFLICSTQLHQFKTLSGNIFHLNVFPILKHPRDDTTSTLCISLVASTHYLAPHMCNNHMCNIVVYCSSSWRLYLRLCHTVIGTWQVYDKQSWKIFGPKKWVKLVWTPAHLLHLSLCSQLLDTFRKYEYIICHLS